MDAKEHDDRYEELECPPLNSSNDVWDKLELEVVHECFDEAR